jgi:outer membrane biosynthesis protein TonB
MPILQLPSNPLRNRDREPAPDAPLDPASSRGTQPVKVRTGRFGELEEHELIHLLDSLDDERSRARFRESVYISVIVYLALAWFLFYGPRVLFHVPQYRDPIALMKQHDQEINLTTPILPRPKPPARALPDRKTLDQLQKQEQARVPAPQPAQPAQQPPPPQEEAHNTAPPAPQPAIPLPSAPRPVTPNVDLPSAPTPRPNFAQNGQTAHDQIQNAMRGALNGRTGAEVGAPSMQQGPLGAGVQVLSDTQGVDFSAYLRRVVADTKRNWIPLIPEEAQPPIGKKGITWIRFTILPNGQIGNMVLEGPSGDTALDEAAWHGITSEGQYPPLPREFHGPNLELRFGFFCNTPVPQ